MLPAVNTYIHKSVHEVNLCRIKKDVVRHRSHRRDALKKK